MHSKFLVSNILTKAFSDAGFELDSPLKIERPQDPSHGDWACTSALSYAKKHGLSPQEVAQKVLEKISDPKVSSTAVAGPGYINITIAPDYYRQVLRGLFPNQVLEDQKWLVEHSSPNLFKPFHVGHLVNNAVGNSVARIIESSGAEVVRLSWPSDVSPGIAKAVWGLFDKGWQDELTIERIGEAYAHGSTEYEKPEVKTEIDRINIALYKQELGKEFELYAKGIKFSMEYLVDIFARLQTHIDGYIFESESEVKGKEIVNSHTPGIFEKSEGATIFRGSEYGLYDDVFVNSAGYGTYLCKDIGNIWHKFDRYGPFEKSLTVTDIEQKQHSQLVCKAAEMIDNEWGMKTVFIQHGRLSLTSGKISSRQGNVPLAEDLLNDVKERVLEKMKDRLIPDNHRDDIAEKVALGALRYAMLKSSRGKNIVFDFEKSLAFEGDSGPYLQYTYVRTASILKKTPDGAFASPTLTGELPLVLRLLDRYPEVVEKSLDEFSPHHIAVYLFEVASAFNTFYAETKILDDTNPAYALNLSITKTTGETLKNGLELLGIEVPDEM